MLFTPSLPPAASAPGAASPALHPAKGHHWVCWKGRGAGRHPRWAASWFLLFIGSKGAAGRCKTWQQGNQSPASCSSPVLGTKLSITARPRHDNADILPLETRAGCGLELQHDAPGPGEEGKGQLAGMKSKQQQIKISTPQTKPKKLISTTKNTVPTGPGSCQLWQWIK